MRYSWTEAKRLTTLEDRSLDFADAPVFFDGRPTITPPTPRELEARRERGETLSDWTKAATRPRPEAHASLRLDAGMLDWFKSQGRGNQTKINAILRSYFQQHGRQEIRASRRR